jgi:chromosome segregation ATPase
MSVAVWALAKQNEYLKAEVQFLGEEYNKVAEKRDDLHLFNHILQGELKIAEERNAFLETSAANGWKDAGDKWAQLLQAKEEMNNLKEKVEALEAWIASPPPAPFSKAALVHDEAGNW